MQSNNISIFGLGYVGCVSLGCLAEQGNTLIGVDISEDKVGLINEGKPTIVEDKIGDLIKKNHENGRISATTDVQKAIGNSNISIICVGTPSDENGHVNLEYIFNTAHEIATSLRNKDSFHVIAIRSTVIPGTNKKYTTIIEEESGKVAGEDFAVVSNPEFLREGTAVKDYFNPPYTVLGTDSEKAEAIMQDLYEPLDAPIHNVDIKVAEMIKYVNNSFHALKISFANEVGNICKSFGIDSHQLMSLFCQDEQLNISPAYLKPGFAYGGSCLPKDLRGINALANDNFITVPVLNAISASNELQKEKAFSIIEEKAGNKVGLIGLSFKAGTDDLRNSPAVDLAEKLLGKGYNLRIYDPNVQVSRLVGKNKSFIDKHIPHLAELLVNDLETVLDASEIIVINQKDEIVKHKSGLADKTVIDLVKLDEIKSIVSNYEGINW